ncbi:MAG: hypothetical protein J0I41_13420 [Filimonas sp.]|nr:hypothetical protein [Filimonas sp.]
MSNKGHYYTTFTGEDAYRFYKTLPFAVQLASEYPAVKRVHIVMANAKCLGVIDTAFYIGFGRELLTKGCVMGARNLLVIANADIDAYSRVREDDLIIAMYLKEISLESLEKKPGAAIIALPQNMTTVNSWVQTWGAINIDKMIK